MEAMFWLVYLFQGGYKQQKGEQYFGVEDVQKMALGYFVDFVKYVNFMTAIALMFAHFDSSWTCLDSWIW